MNKLNDEKRNCAFQYYNGSKVAVDEVELTLDEAKQLFNDWYEDMVDCAESAWRAPIEVAIWVNMSSPDNYKETLIHFHDPLVENGILVERTPTYYRKFKL